MPKDISLRKNLSWSDLEAVSSTLKEARTERVRLWLPRDIGADFFKETRVVSLFAQANRTGGFTLVDWIEQSTPDRDQERYGAELLGLAGLIYAREILTSTKEPLGVDKHNVIASVIAREGILEPPLQRGTVITFCAFDEAAPDTPIVFAACTNKPQFTTELLEYRRRYLEQGIANGYSRRTKQMELIFNGESPDTESTVDVTLTGEQDEALAGFVYELFLNSFQHGCLNEDGQVIPGLRFVRMKRHIGNKRDDMLRRSIGFPELTEYIKQVTPSARTSAFYEISISDQGLGILDRFLATRPEYAEAAAAPEERVHLVNRIINERLSSKRTLSGAGKGLENAIKAAKELKGFVSLRTNDLWLYNAYGSQCIQPNTPLIPVRDGTNLPRVVGTTFNMLFPLH